MKTLIIALAFILVGTGIYYAFSKFSGWTPSSPSRTTSQPAGQTAKSDQSGSQTTSQPRESAQTTLGQSSQDNTTGFESGSEGAPLSASVSGFKINVLREGAGEGAKNGDTVAVHYVGTLTNGTKFDSSRDRGQLFSFTLGAGQVIRGWDLGILGMKRGEIRKLTIPSSLGYGSSSVGSIPANSTLIFEVELFTINGN